MRTEDKMKEMDTGRRRAGQDHGLARPQAEWNDPLKLAPVSPDAFQSITYVLMI